MALTTFSDIPRSTLAGLLDVAGKARGISPRLLMGDASDLTPGQMAELYAGKFIELPGKAVTNLTPEFARVARVLLDPRTNITLRIWGKDNMSGETNFQFPKDVLHGGGVIFNQIGRMYRIGAFVDESNITKLLSQAVPAPKEQDLQFEFKAHLDNPVAAILFAIVDLARIRATKANRPGGILNMVFVTQEVYSYMYDRWALTGLKDLITYITAVGIMPEAPSLTDTVDGLRLLVKTGLLKENSADHFSLTKALEPMVTLTLGLCSGLQWQRVSLMDSGEVFVNHRLFLFGNRSFMLCLAPTTKGRIYVSRIRRQEIIDYLADELAVTVKSDGQKPAAASAPAPAPVAAAAPPPPPPPPEPTAPKPAPVPQAAPVSRPAAQVFCTKCGAPLKPGAKFCPGCGAVAGQAAKAAGAAVCPNCGSPLKAGAKFCTKCGATVTAQQAQPIPAVCPNCGNQLKPGAKFCANCGAQLK